MRTPNGAVHADIRNVWLIFNGHLLGHSAWSGHSNQSQAVFLGPRWNYFRRCAAAHEMPVFTAASTTALTTAPQTHDSATNSRQRHNGRSTFDHACAESCWGRKATRKIEGAHTGRGRWPHAIANRPAHPRRARHGREVTETECLALVKSRWTLFRPTMRRPRWSTSVMCSPAAGAGFR
jgi:hypothetical protein